MAGPWAIGGVDQLLKLLFSAGVDWPGCKGGGFHLGRSIYGL